MVFGVVWPERRFGGLRSPFGGEVKSNLWLKKNTLTIEPTYYLASRRVERIRVPESRDDDDYASYGRP